MRKLIQDPNYKIGDTRIVRKFLFLPMTLENKNGEYEKRWLEFAEWEEYVWSKSIYKPIQYGWAKRKWVN